MSALSLQSCPTLQPYGLQPTRVLRPWGFPDKNTGWLTMPSSRGASQPRDQAHVSCDCCIAGRFFITWATQETHIHTTIWTYCITQDTIQCPVITYNGKLSEKEFVSQKVHLSFSLTWYGKIPTNFLAKSICIPESLFRTPKTNTAL